MSAIAYLKAQCGWSRGVREVLAKYNIEYEERQIHDPVNFQEMVEKTGQTNQPCVQLNEEFILVDISGEELQSYLIENGYDQTDTDSNIPLDRSCTEEEHAKMRMNAPVPQPAIRDTTFRGF